MSLFQKLKRLSAPFWQAFGPYKWSIIFLASLGFLSGLFEAVGVNTLIPLFSFLTQGGAAGDDVISRGIIWVFSWLRIEVRMSTFLLLIAVLFLLKALVLLVFNQLRAVVRSGFEKERQEALLRKMLAADWSHLLRQKIGHLETLLMIDVRMSAKLFEVVADSLVLITSLFMYLLVAINISWWATVVTLVIGVAFFILVRPVLRRIKVFARQTATINKEITHLVGESIAGLKTIKSFDATDTFLQKGRNRFDSLRRLQIRAALLSKLATVFIQPISVVYILVIFTVAHIYYPSFSFAALAALIYLIHRIFTYIQTIQGNLQHIVDLAPYLQDTLAYESLVQHHREETGGDKQFLFQKELSFNQIQFSYQPESPVLSGVSFKINRGELIGIIGASGAGKTTIFDLLLRLFQPTGGSISLDGVMVNEIKISDWRAHLGYAPQDTFLLNDTIENNIRFFNPTVTMADVEMATSLAHLDSFIQTLPLGYSTPVGERGVRLSAGQRQRIGIARALVKKPDILLLDEVTSALDGESELEIQRALEDLKGRFTVLVIAHRLSTVNNSDRLIVLDKGQIVEEASPQELLADKQSYFYRISNIRS